MALKLKYTDEHGILHIDMSPTTSPTRHPTTTTTTTTTDITDPKFDTINHRFAQYDLFGGNYDVELTTNCKVEGEPSLFRSRYNSIEEELANTPYAFATERSMRLRSENNNPVVDITIKSRDDASPSRDIEDDRFFNRNYGLFGPSVDSKTSDEEEAPAFTVTQLIHAQDRYYDLSSRQTSSVCAKSAGTNIEVRSGVKIGSATTGAKIGSGTTGAKIGSGTTGAKTGAKSAGPKGIVRELTNNFEVRSTGSAASRGTDSSVDGAFRIIGANSENKAVQVQTPTECSSTLSSGKKKKESSFAILTELPATSRPASPRSLPVEIRSGRVSPFKGRGFREETSRHNTPKTSASNSRASSPLRRRTNSLPRIDKMAQTATLPPPTLHLSRPHSPRNFVKENIEEVRGISELNREIHEAEAERKRVEEEEAILKEMGLIDKKSDGVRSNACSRANSRSNSPSRLKLRSRSNSPSAVLCFENIPADSKEYINPDDGMPKPAIRKSRAGRALSKSLPQSSDVSPKHSKIPKRQSSVSPAGSESRRDFVTKKTLQTGILKNQRFMSNSTSSIHETIRIGSQVHDKRAISKSTQLLDIGPSLIKGKPPISPGRGGPPPSNRTINPKRLSPIVGTPNKSPVEDQKPSSLKATPTKSTVGAKKTATKPVSTGSTTSRLTKQARVVGRDPSPDKRRVGTKPTPTTVKVNGTGPTKPVSRAASTKTAQKPTVTNNNKPEPKKSVSRTNSMKSLTRTPSTKTLNEKPPILKKRDSKTDLRSKSSTKLNEVGTIKQEPKKDPKSADVRKSALKKEKEKETEKKEETTSKVNTKPDSFDVATQKQIANQDSETQYDKITNDKGDLVIMTKKNIVSMTTAAITSQPLEIVTTVTNQLPAAFEKAREKGIFERLNSKDSIAPKEEDKVDDGKATKESNHKDTKESDEKASKTKSERSTLFSEDNVKLRPLQPPYNNPAVERVRQKIDSILKEPEVSPENILASTIKAREKEAKSSFRSVANKTKSEVKETKDAAAAKLTEIKDQAVKQKEKATSEIRTEATKIIESIMTPVEEPKPATNDKPKVAEIKKDIEPIVTVVNEKNKNGPSTSDVTVKVNETLVQGEPEVEVQSSNLSTPGVEKMAIQNKMAESSGSDKSEKSVSNGGFPQSTSTTPKPPARAHRQKETKDDDAPPTDQPPPPDQTKQLNICQRLLNKCKSKCCPCCTRPHDDDDEVTGERKTGTMGRLNCFRSRDMEQEDKVRDLERSVGKAATIEYENETRPKRTFRDVICCCRDRRRVSDSSDVIARDVTSDVTGEVIETGCCGSKKRVVERRDSILSDRPPNTCCNNKLCNWLRGACRRRQSDHSSSRRTSMFSKNKSLSPTLPPEDTRKKLDPSLIEHTSVMRGAIPVLPLVLAYFCLICNIVVPGLGSIFSGMFCLCFGIPRFGVHDGAKHRIGSFVINLLVGCGQLFTVLFCLVGWGWSIWWGVILLKTARKYRKLKAEAAVEDAENVPPVTSNNHTQP